MAETAARVVTRDVRISVGPRRSPFSNSRASSVLLDDVSQDLLVDTSACAPSSTAPRGDAPEEWDKFDQCRIFRPITRRPERPPL